MRILSIRNAFTSAPVYYIKETDSTMEVARGLLKEKPPTGALIVTDYQRKGRGRIPGRVWEADSGKNLLFTQIFRKGDVPQEVSFVLTLLGGLAVAEAVERTCGVSPRIKWPNDLILQNRKLSGILCINTGGYFLLGVGVNVNQESFPSSNRGISLRQTIGKPVDRYTLLENYTDSILELFQTGLWRRNLEQRLYCMGEKIDFIPGDPKTSSPLYAEVVGINAAGGVLLRINGETKSYFSGEFVWGTGK